MLCALWQGPDSAPCAPLLLPQYVFDVSEDVGEDDDDFDVQMRKLEEQI